MPGGAESRPGPIHSRRNRVCAFNFSLPEPPSGVRKTAILGFCSGILLGCLFGAVMRTGSAENGRPQQEMLGVNPNTGKPQLHIKGKPEIK